MSGLRVHLKYMSCHSARTDQTRQVLVRTGRMLQKGEKVQISHSLVLF